MHLWTTGLLVFTFSYCVCHGKFWSKISQSRPLEITMGIVHSWQWGWGAVWWHDWWSSWADVWQLWELPWAARRQRCQVLWHQHCNRPLCSPSIMTATLYSNCLPCAGSSGHVATALSVVISMTRDWLILLHNLLWARIIILEWRAGVR